MRRRGVPRSLPLRLRGHAETGRTGQYPDTCCTPCDLESLAHGVPFCLQAGDYQKTARFYYKKAEDTYYQANNWAAYDDWRRARDQWDYFYSRNR